MARVLQDIIDERHRQDQKWGPDSSHPNGTSPGRVWAFTGPASYVVESAQQECRRKFNEGVGSWLDILLEEVAEAFAEADPTKLREELVDIAAVAVAWIENIDRLREQHDHPPATTDDRQPTVSVLLPTRGRPQLLERSIESLAGRASTPHEICIAVDPDDTPTLEYLADRVAAFDDGTNWAPVPGTLYHLPSYPADIRWKILVTTERYGYHQLNRYYDLLASAAAGEWLLLWNDDAVMETPGWDAKLWDLRPSVLVADLQTVHSPHLCTFPAVRRTAVKIAGGFSPHTPHCDTWWQDIGRRTNTIRPVGIQVTHDRYDITGNNRDQTYRDSQAGYRSAEFYGPDVQRHLGVACAAIEQHKETLE